jgi:colicin import membrane protein
MAERQETSVMVSIQEILRDAQNREEQEKAEAEQRARAEEQRRLDDMRRRQEEEQARLRAEESDRQRRAFEEQKRQAELQGMQEAAVHKARAEAEAQARLAEMTARQEHERQLHALSQDQGKKRLRMMLGGIAVLLLAVAVGGGVMIKNAVEKNNSLQQENLALQAEKDRVEDQTRKLKFELDNTQDPAKIAELTAQLQQAKDKMSNLQQQQNGTGGGVARPAPRPVTGGGAKPAGPKAPCNCTPGDPLCSCL